MTLNPGQPLRTVRLPNPFHFTLNSFGWVHEPSSAASAGQYRRMSMANRPFGAGSQFDSLSLPGRCHGGRDTGRIAIEQYACIQSHCTVRFKRGVLVGVGHCPGAIGVGIDVHAIDARLVGDCTSGGIGKRCGFVRQLLHAGIRAEGLSSNNADGCELTAHFRSNRIDGLDLHQLVEVFEETEITANDRAETFAGKVKEFSRRRVVGLGQRIDLEL